MLSCGLCGADVTAGPCPFFHDAPGWGIACCRCVGCPNALESPVVSAAVAIKDARGRTAPHGDVLGGWS